SSTNNQQSIKSSSYEYNSTHLWSIRLADENYFRLAHLLPCRIVEYSGGPNPCGACNSSTPDCVFLPITNYSIPSKVDGNQTIKINANIGYWLKPICPFIFQNRIFNWYHAQLLSYLMRYKPETLAHAQNTIAQYFKPPSIDLHHPYIAVYGRRPDKVRNKEMSQAYTLKQCSDLFDADARRTNIKTIYINSEDENVFNEFVYIKKEKQGYYKLLNITVQRNVVFASLIVIYLLKLNADLHVGTLTSNWYRLVDEIRLVLGKTIPFYTPENQFLIGM
ncbi:unnamed protein product, partial [Rotaria sordida]